MIRIAPYTPPSLFDAYTKGERVGREDYDRDTLGSLAEGYRTGGLEGARTAAAQRGDFTRVAQVDDTLRQRQVQDRSFKLQEGSAGLERQRFGMDQQRFTLQKQQMEAEAEARASQRMTGIAEMVLNEPDQARAAQIWGRVSAHPQFSKAVSSLGVDPSDYRTAAQAVIASARGATDPDTRRLRSAQATQAEAHAELYKAQAAAKGGNENEFRVRETEAQRLGLTPNDPTYRSYVLTGKMPREDQQPLSATDKKAILEADETVAASQNAVRSLTEAINLSRRSYSGMGAGTLATAADRLLPWSTPQATATTQLDNLVAAQALENLKSTFGGAPTEGERKILLEIQGSVNQSKEARESIYRRAVAAAERRLEFNRQRADALRGQTFYKPGGQPQRPDAAPQGAAPVAPGVASDPSQLSNEELLRQLGAQ